MSAHAPLELIVPRNGTAVLQHLQRLVGREGHRHWCGGTIPILKVAPFLEKMADRYPILRSTRERSYDRHRGRGVVHLVVSPPFGSAPHRRAPALLWWLLSDEGTGGLADPASLDAHVARNAMSGTGHLQVHAYVLMYATKRQPHHVIDRRTGNTRRIWTDLSSWTWKIQKSVLTEVKKVSTHVVQTLSSDRIPLWNVQDGVYAAYWLHSAAARSFPVYAIKLLRCTNMLGRHGRATGPRGWRRIPEFPNRPRVSPDVYARSRKSSRTTCPP